MGHPFLMIPIHLKLIKSKKGTNNRLILSMLLRFNLADKGRAFSLGLRLLNVDRYYFFPIRLTKET